MGRNEPCWCGSGRKYKRCCLERDKVAAPGFLGEPPYGPLLERGYLAWDQAPADAAEAWLTFWQQLAAAWAGGTLAPPSRWAEEDQAVLSHWLGDMSEVLRNERIGREDLTPRHVAWVEAVLALSPRWAEVEAQVPTLTDDLADAYFALGEEQRGAALYQELAERYPGDPWPYLWWGDQYARFAPPERRDLDRARSLYHHAQARAAGQDQETVAERLHELDEPPPPQ